MDKEIETIFNGTPAEFGGFLRSAKRVIFSKFSSAQFFLEKSKGKLIDIADYPDIAYLRVVARLKDENGIGMFYISVFALPGRKSMLRADCLDLAWPKVSGIWESLICEGQRQGWIDGTDCTHDVLESQRSKPGRPRNVDDDWALDQVRQYGRNHGEVYKEWLGRIGDGANALADPEDSFEKAISLKRNKTGTKRK
ncbi:hypothetical protein EHM76_00420 [bacterium]|nr:MAG: hypothetical protein EHM76_00420 [bacterium]